MAFCAYLRFSHLFVAILTSFRRKSPASLQQRRGVVLIQFDRAILATFNERPLIRYTV